MGNFYHMVFYQAGGMGKEIHGGGGIPCDTGFNRSTEKVAEKIVMYGKY